MKKFISVLLAFSLTTPSFAYEIRGKDFYSRAFDLGITGAINAFTSASGGICLASSKGSSTSGVLDDLISKAFNSYDSCRNVFTGNEGDYENPDQAYARTFAYSMAQDICTGNKPGSLADLLEHPQIDLDFNSKVNKEASWDAFSIPKFGEGTKKQKSPENLVATYALVYSLGLRESSGNFNKGSSGESTPQSRASGVIQISADSMNTYEVPKESSLVLRTIFSKYVTGLFGKSKAEQSALCLTDKVQGSSKSKGFDSTGSKLNTTFSDGSCGQAYEKVSKPGFKVTNDVANCFQDLSKMCPSFTIKYGAAAARLRRFGHGPLMTQEEHAERGRHSAAYKKDMLEPACHSLFKSLIENKEKICAELSSESSAAAAPDISTEVSSQLSNSEGQVELGSKPLEIPRTASKEISAPAQDPRTKDEKPLVAIGIEEDAPPVTRSVRQENRDSVATNTSKNDPNTPERSPLDAKGLGKLNEEGLKRRLESMTTQGSNSCARGVRQSLNELFGKHPDYGDSDNNRFKKGSINAKEYDERILSQWETESAKYKKMSDSNFNGPFSNFDVRVLKPSGSCSSEAVNNYGHIEFYYNGKWYSDFAQGNYSGWDSNNQTNCYASQSVYRLSPK